MALTINIDQRRPQRVGLHLRMVTGSFDLDNSYATGGYDLSGLSNKFRTLHRVTCDQTGGYIFQFDKANNKLKVFYPTKNHSHKAFTVKATETAADSTTFVSIIEGDGTAQTGIKVSNAGGAGSNIDINSDEQAAAPGPEVGNGVDLHTVTGISFIAVGR